MQRRHIRHSAKTKENRSAATEISGSAGTAVLQPPAHRQTVQLVLNVDNAAKKARTFSECHERERELIGKANEMLLEYTSNPSEKLMVTVNKTLSGIRDEIDHLNSIQAGIVGEFAVCEQAEVRKVFLDRVLSRNSDELRPLFEKLMTQTDLSEDVSPGFKNQFLSWVLQSIKLGGAGEGRFRELMALLGDRRVSIDTIGMGGPKAGLGDFDIDNPKAEKTNARDPAQDLITLARSGDNLAEFVKAKRMEGDIRGVNEQRGAIGNLKLIMDRDPKFLPLFYGLTNQNDVQIYTSPKFAAIHHELGHMTNALKGKHGRKEDKYKSPPLMNLTDEEEVHNISLDTHSDKALTDQMGLPERIAHGAFTSLNKATPALDHRDVSGDLQKWEELTYNLVESRTELATAIQSLANKNWSKHTSYKSAPNGVAEIRKLLATLNPTSRGLGAQLDRVKLQAISSQNESSSNRTEATKKFYQILAEMTFNTEHGITRAIAGMETIDEMWFS